MTDSGVQGSYDIIALRRLLPPAIAAEQKPPVRRHQSQNIASGAATLSVYRQSSKISPGFFRQLPATDVALGTAAEALSWLES